MSIYYYKISYVENAGFGKKIPIGIILATSAYHVNLRILGATSQAYVNASQFTRLTKQESAEWVYREWVDWFYELVNHYNGYRGETIFAVLDELHEKGGSITVSAKRKIKNTEEKSLEEILNELYKSNVTP